MSAKKASEDEPNAKAGGRKALLIDYINKKVSIITNDGRNIVGSLLGFDQVCNVILDKSTERSFAADSGVQLVPLGLYVIRGDNIAILGEVDLAKDAEIPWEKTKGHPINRVVH